MTPPKEIDSFLLTLLWIKICKTSYKDFIIERKLDILIVFISQSYFKVPK